MSDAFKKLRKEQVEHWLRMPEEQPPFPLLPEAKQLQEARRKELEIKEKLKVLVNKQKPEIRSIISDIKKEEEIINKKYTRLIAILKALNIAEKRVTYEFAIAELSHILKEKTRLHERLLVVIYELRKT